MKKLKTYSESKNKQPFDWNKALSVNCKDMTKADAKLMMKRAESWVTCACGNQCDVLERDKEGEPTDAELSQLGKNFYLHGVRAMACSLYPELNNSPYHTYSHLQSMSNANAYRKDAIRYLHKIEKRSAKLIKDETEKTKAILLKLGYKVTKK